LTHNNTIKILMCENEQMPDWSRWQRYKRESSGVWATYIEPRIPELKAEPCSCEEELRSCVIFTKVRQPYLKMMKILNSIWEKWSINANMYKSNSKRKRYVSMKN